MRTVLLLFSLAYGGAALDDTELIKPSQPASLQTVLENGIPDWMGTSARVDFGD